MQKSGIIMAWGRRIPSPFFVNRPTMLLLRLPGRAPALVYVADLHKKLLTFMVAGKALRAQLFPSPAHVHA
jgi:hypothetical protein